MMNKKLVQNIVLAMTIASGGEIVYYYDQITGKCSRTGVFVDSNWVGGCNIYSA